MACSAGFPTCAESILLSCRSALDGLLRIAKHEGPGVLWRGTDLSLLVAVPMVAMYFPLYDSLLQSFQSAGVGQTQAVPPLLNTSSTMLIYTNNCFVIVRAAPCALVQ